MENSYLRTPTNKTTNNITSYPSLLFIIIITHTRPNKQERVIKTHTHTHTHTQTYPLRRRNGRSPGVKNKKRKKRNIEHGKFIFADLNKQNNNNITSYPSLFFLLQTRPNKQEIEYKPVIITYLIVAVSWAIRIQLLKTYMGAFVNCMIVDLNK